MPNDILPTPVYRVYQTDPANPAEKPTLVIQQNTPIPKEDAWNSDQFYHAEAYVREDGTTHTETLAPYAQLPKAGPPKSPKAR